MTVTHGRDEKGAMSGASNTSRTASFDTLRLSAALSMLGAGLMHLMIVPEHVDHAPAHGWFFAAAGAVQIAWSALGWRRTRRAVDIFGMVLAGSLILLWAVTRIYRAPFSTQAEVVDGAGLISKGLEAASFVALTVVLAREGDRRGPWVGTFLAVIASIGLYVGGRWVEPAFPGLWAQESGTVAEAGVHSHVIGQRVRLDDQPMGPWVVRVLTSPVPPSPDNFLVEVRVKDAATGRVRRDVGVTILARLEGDTSEPLQVTAGPEAARIPGEFAAQIPVPEAGIWLITIQVDGPEGPGQGGFAERVASPLGLGTWMSALLPFAGLALLVIGYAALTRAFPSDS